MADASEAVVGKTCDGEELFLPALPAVDEIGRRLADIFPEGVEVREYILRKDTKRSIFACLYVGAIQGSGRQMAPRHIYRMRDSIADDHRPEIRLDYYANVPASGEGRWYADNSREGARDEGIRRGLIPLGAMIKDETVPVTSSRGRYSLSREFAALLDPALTGSLLEQAVAKWRQEYLTPATLARISYGQVQSSHNVEVKHPGGGSTVLPAGKSAVLTKQVVEEFSKRFLVKPALVWISDSQEKMFGNDKLIKSLRIDIDPAKLLPDIVMVDLSPQEEGNKIMIVFIEVVSTDGPIDSARQQALYEMATDGGYQFEPQDIAFVTAYHDRGDVPASKAMRRLAWGSYAWFASEPDRIVSFTSMAGISSFGTLRHI